MSTDTRELATQDSKTAAAIAESQQDAIDLALKVRYAAALGWAMTELLARCYLIESGYHRPPDQPDFCADYPVILSPVLDPVERICTVTGRILYLANELGVDGPYSSNGNRDSLHCEIDNLRFHLLPDSEPQNIVGNTPCTQKQNTTPHEMKNCTSCRQMREKVNKLLFKWGESIEFTLQSGPPAIYNAYTVGRGFATIRWYIGVGNTAKEEKSAKQGDEAAKQESEAAKLDATSAKTKQEKHHAQPNDNPTKSDATTEMPAYEPQFTWRWYIRWCTGLGKAQDDDKGVENQTSSGESPAQEAPTQGSYKRDDKLVTIEALNKLRDHLHSMSCYLPPFVAESLDYSLNIWGQAIIDHKDNLNTAILDDRKRKLGEKNREEARNVREKGYERMRLVLTKQSIIWHDLLTGDRDPSTYVKPHAITREYVRRLFAFSIPFIIAGLILAFVIAFAIVHIQDFLLPSTSTKAVPNTAQSITDNTITNAIITIITATATIPIIRTLWLWASKTTTNFVTNFMVQHKDALYDQIETSGKDALSLFWQRSQQVAINQATYLSPKPSLFHRVFPFLLRIPKKDGDGDDGD